MAPETFEQREARWALGEDKKGFMNLPKKNFKYLNSKNECMYPAQDGIRFWRPDEGCKPIEVNPAIERARRNGTLTYAMERYWRRFPYDMCLPVAGIPLDERRAEQQSAEPAPSRKRKAVDPPAEPERRSKRLLRPEPEADEPIDQPVCAKELSAAPLPTPESEAMSGPEALPEPAHGKDGASTVEPEMVFVPEAGQPANEKSQPEQKVQAPPANSKPKPKPKTTTKPKAESKARVSKAKAISKSEVKAKQESIAEILEEKLLDNKLPELRDPKSQGDSWLARQAQQNREPVTPLWTPILPKKRDPAAAQGPPGFPGLKPDLYRPAPAVFFVPSRPSLAGWHKLIADDVELSQEDGFHSRPSIKLVMPDHLKALLVDDWENVTKNNQLVPLPHPHPVNEILEEYLAYEKPHRGEGTAAMDILEETIAGLREYFDKSLGRILLYRFERPQYSEIRGGWETSTDDSKKEGPCSTYGAEHLCRLLELVGQTNMDQQSVNRLREEIVKLTNWLGKHATKYFVSEYEIPPQEYIDKARGV
ncbi:putative histone acetylase complex subunit protein [Phaeoacremonium minimum UCRPA7]|uniref:Chromatin modification-related protein EAF3 n=1 Tax=Phaeoacremonium minimum (strain UCR-PA7) TaxID=1286976 RepID=R8BJ69_PHAM7|nr:putative histone acetylase complex subunit protein [Phaeoacremonium minimum UCRPA7]EON99365.1 putative histone acetylase complex subunit protein [Phaeoacremonium minimum UCRPA7]